MSNFYLTDYVEPKTLEEAQQRLDDLKAAAGLMQMQLSDRNRTIDGRRMNDVEYWTWRKRAGHAHQAKLAELRLLKQWISNNRQQNERIRNLNKRETDPIIKEASNAFKALTAVTWELQDRVSQLEAENEELHQKVIDLTTELRGRPLNTTTTGRYEDWRDDK